MDLHIVTSGNHEIMEGPPGQPLLQSTDDANRVLEICFEHHTELVLLYAENLPGHFFDISSGEAGALLQKFRQYHVRLAVVVPEGSVPQSTKFQDMVREERGGSHFRVFEDTQSAEFWLAEG